MKILEGRGLHTKKTAEKNKQAIKKWFKKNPSSTKKDCCDALGLSYATVRKHINALSYE